MSDIALEGGGFWIKVIARHCAQTKAEEQDVATQPSTSIKPPIHQQSAAISGRKKTKNRKTKEKRQGTQPQRERNAKRQRTWFEHREDESESIQLRVSLASRRTSGYRGYKNTELLTLEDGPFTLEVAGGDRQVDSL